MKTVAADNVFIWICISHSDVSHSTGFTGTLSTLKAVAAALAEGDASRSQGQ